MTIGLLVLMVRAQPPPQLLPISLLVYVGLDIMETQLLVDLCALLVLIHLIPLTQTATIEMQMIVRHVLQDIMEPQRLLRAMPIATVVLRATMLPAVPVRSVQSLAVA